MHSDELDGALDRHDNFGALATLFEEDEPGLAATIDDVRRFGADVDSITPDPSFVADLGSRLMMMADAWGPAVPPQPPSSGSFQATPIPLQRTLPLLPQPPLIPDSMPRRWRLVLTALPSVIAAVLVLAILSRPAIDLLNRHLELDVAFVHIGDADAWTVHAELGDAGIAPLILTATPNDTGDIQVVVTNKTATAKSLEIPAVGTNLNVPAQEKVHAWIHLDEGVFAVIVGDDQSAAAQSFATLIVGGSDNTIESPLPPETRTRMSPLELYSLCSFERGAAIGNPGSGTNRELVQQSDHVLIVSTTDPDKPMLAWTDDLPRFAYERQVAEGGSTDQSCIDLGGDVTAGVNGDIVSIRSAVLTTAPVVIHSMPSWDSRAVDDVASGVQIDIVVTTQGELTADQIAEGMSLVGSPFVVVTDQGPWVLVRTPAGALGWLPCRL
jgi:hypothetical protein